MKQEKCYKMSDVCSDNVNELEKEFRCDDCKKTFLGKDIILFRDSDNVTIIPPPYMNRVIKKIDGNDYVLACPHCKHVHLFGFDKVVIK